MTSCMIDVSDRPRVSDRKIVDIAVSSCSMIDPCRSAVATC